MLRDLAFENRVRQRLAQWQRHEPDAAGLRRAAVAMVLTDEGHGGELPGLPRHAQWSEQAAIIVTRRAATLRAHAGQFALPGGRVDEGETAQQAALRELHEEVGLVLDAGAIIGLLDDVITRSGYAITPVVMWTGAAMGLQPNPDEVASIHRIPLTELLRADAPMLTPMDDSDVPVLRMPVGQGWIAAPTAAMLYQFREVCLLGRETRVQHFEQPRFAWK
ncbi:NUDIX hydrolase [Aquabacterium sp.]|uniref:NUDIX hydrolase n=1 Tax=Aquabacterium sp. TaxID=1872578 RepID=UPI002CFE4FDB|nr:CoA pyrophosphatase [Aquabacterium sp.]HSW08295.1 CoA pyrophosphatase [Aquabacterium sp.]